MDVGHVLKLSSEDGQLIVTLQGPRGGVLSSGPVTLDEMALDGAEGPAHYSDALLAAVLREPVGGALRRAGVTRVRLALADDVRHLHSAGRSVGPSSSTRLSTLLLKTSLSLVT